MGQTIIANLHNHSAASDGEYSPTELVQRAKQLGLQDVGLTDHDTIDGLDEAIQPGDHYGVKVLPGVEVSQASNRPYFVRTHHFLLYFTNDFLNNPDFKSMLTEILSQGRGLTLVDSRVKAINDVFGHQGEQPLLKRKLLPEELTSHS